VAESDEMIQKKNIKLIATTARVTKNVRSNSSASAPEDQDSTLSTAKTTKKSRSIVKVQYKRPRKTILNNASPRVSRITPHPIETMTNKHLVIPRLRTPITTAVKRKRL
jgi:hypothetical protein